MSRADLLAGALIQGLIYTLDVYKRQGDATRVRCPVGWGNGWEIIFSEKSVSRLQRDLVE